MIQELPSTGCACPGIEIRQEGFSPAMSRGSLLKDGRRGARIRRRAGWSIIADKIKWGLGLPWASRKESYYTLFAMLRGCCILFTTRLCLPALSRQPRIMILWHKRNVLSSRSICQVQVWQRLWLMASQGRYRVVRTLDSRACLQWSARQSFNIWLISPCSTGHSQCLLRLHRANINNPYWLGQEWWLTHPQKRSTIYLAKALGWTRL